MKKTKMRFIGLALMLGTAISSTQTQANPLTQMRLVNATNGELQAINQWQGKVRVVNFWATWCRPCRQEMPMLNQMSQRFSPLGVQIIGIALDQKVPVNNFANELGIRYPLLLTESGGGISLLRAWGSKNAALPYTVVLNRTGDIVWQHTGILDNEQLAQIIRQHLQ